MRNERITTYRCVGTFWWTVNIDGASETVWTMGGSDDAIRIARVRMRRSAQLTP